MVEVLRPYAANRWLESEDTYALTSPSTGEELGRVVRSTTADIDAAVQAARTAFDTNRWTPLRDRVALCHRIADLIDGRADDLARGLAAEHGKPLAEARGEVAKGAEGFRLAAEEVRRLDGSVVPTEDPAKRVLVIRQARGV